MSTLTAGWARFFNNGSTPVVVMIMLVALVTPLIAARPAYLDTSVTIATFSLIAISLGLSYGLGGMLSFAQATFASLGAYATAIVTMKLEVSPLVGLIFSITVPMVLAYGMARLIVRLSPLALGLATLAFSQLVQLLINEGGELTGGYVGLSGIPPIPFLPNLFSGHLFGWFLVAVVLLIYVRLRTSNHGRALRTISTDSVLAASLGIPVTPRLSAAFALSAAIAGMGGWYYAHMRSYLAPSSLSLDLSFMIAIAVIVGGRRTLLGPVFGTVLVVLLQDSLPGSEVHGMFYGAGLILALLVFPEGVLGEDWKGRIRRGFGRDTSNSDVSELRKASAGAGGHPTKIPVGDKQ
jgi:branched-chain amino acid transport system permease protein